MTNNDRDLWNAFALMGRIEDYLRFRGVDIYSHIDSKNSKAKAAEEETKFKNKGINPSLLTDLSEINGSVQKREKGKGKNGHPRFDNKRK